MTPTLSPQPEAAPSGMVERIEDVIVREMGMFVSPSRRRHLARAMLEAMRHPTARMKGYGGACLQGITHGSYDLAHDTYTTMIDAALEEGA